MAFDGEPGHQFGGTARRQSSRPRRSVARKRPQYHLRFAQRSGIAGKIGRERRGVSAGRRIGPQPDHRPIVVDHQQQQRPTAKSRNGARQGPALADLLIVESDARQQARGRGRRFEKFNRRTLARLHHQRVQIGRGRAPPAGTRRRTARTRRDRRRSSSPCAPPDRRRARAWRNRVQRHSRVGTRRSTAPAASKTPEPFWPEASAPPSQRGRWSGRRLRRRHRGLGTGVGSAVATGVSGGRAAGATSMRTFMRPSPPPAVAITSNSNRPGRLGSPASWLIPLPRSFRVKPSGSPGPACSATGSCERNGGRPAL